MQGFATSPNPYISGIKPRTFLSSRVALLKWEQRMKKVDRDHYPKYGEEKLK